MKKVTSKVVALLTAMFVIVSMITGCSIFGGGTDNFADEPAIKYVTNICNGKWDAVLKDSTGDQLSIYMQLVPVLKSTKQTTELKRAEVVDRAISSDKKLAFVTIHVVKNVNIPDYGSVLDDKQVLLSMKVLDGQWKIFKMDIVNDLKTKLGK